MAKKPARAINVAVNSVALEDEITSVSLDIKQEIPQVDGLSSTGPERVVGNYDYGMSLEGSHDGAAGQGDATLHALIGNSGVAVAFDPTGNAAGTDDPNYDAAGMVLESYSIKGQVGGAVTYSAQLQGNGALARNTS